REAEGWYVSFSCAEVPIGPRAPTGRETGSEVGGRCFWSPPKGESIENPRHYRRAEQRLAKAQQRLSRRKKGSQRRAKARRREGEETGRHTPAAGEAAAPRLPPPDRAVARAARWTQA